MIQLPRSITGAQPTGKPDDLRAVRPTILAPSPTDTKATAHAIGAHVLRLRRGFQTRSAKLDGVPVLFAREGRAVHLFCDSTVGVVEVIGLSSEQVAGVHEWLDAAAVVPETELDAVLERVAARNPGRVDLDPTDTHPDTKRALKILGLTDAIHPDIDNTARATASKAGSSAEVERLLTLAATMDDGNSSGDSEVDRLARMAENLSDG